MAFPRLNEDLDIVAKMDDEPNDVGGLSADAFKAVFDMAPNYIKDYLNNILLEFLEGEAGAQNIGISPIEDVNATDVQRALEILRGQIKQAVIGSIPDHSITDQQLATAAVLAYNLAANSVESDKIADGAVTDNKIVSVSASKVTGELGSNNFAAKSVTADKINDFAIVANKLSIGAVVEEKIGTGAVVADKIAEKAVTADKIASGSVSQTYTATIGTEWTGDAAPYTQEIAITGMTADDKPAVGVVYSDTYETAEAQKEAWAMVYRIKTDADKITVYATDKTETEIPIQLTCVRK